ncbi:helix-turn-helix domain-containing protein, partial [Salmonella enterica]|uniref:helix-turn-helix domain-containing protein n=1 Tax=Salmonella enterica TaxID=28901 RepID=UPI003524A98E
SALTPHGHEIRERIEIETDRQMDRSMEALGDGLDELLGILLPWGAAIRAAKGYPASGPHDLADSVARR